MKENKQTYGIEEVRSIDMVDYLMRLGHGPSKIRRDDYWYLSPLHNEKTASFKINRKINRWYDFGIGKGGNIIDFAILYYDCTVGQFLQRISGDFSFRQPLVQVNEMPVKTEPIIYVVRESTISSFPLLQYLKERRIPIRMAQKFCREVHYEMYGKTYYGIGFRNDSGGYEIRNAFFKTSSSPKDITTIVNGSKEVFVFEGFFDFLSFMTISKNLPESNSDFLILNTISFFEKARPFMESHESIRLFLDLDSTGQNYSRYALSLSEKYKDESHLYRQYKDLNDWIMHFGMP